MRPDASHSIRITAPASEPITLAEVKAHLRIDGSDEDGYLTALITAARERLENETRRSFLRQQWRATIHAVAEGCAIELPRPRLILDDSSPFLLEYKNASGDWVGVTGLEIDESREPAHLWLNEIPSDLSSDRRRWRVTYWSGYGATAADVPQPIRHAIMLLVAHLFERREVVISGATIHEVPKALDWMLDPYRVPWGGVIK